MFWWLVQNTLLAGVLALAAALAGRFGRLSPAVRHALWLVVLAKLVTPPLIFYSLPEGEAWAEWLAAGPLFDAPQQTTSAEASPQPAGERAAAERLALIPAETAKEEPQESVVEVLQFPLSEFEDSSESELAETAEALAPILLDDEAAVAPELSPPTDLQSTAVGARATRAESVALVRMSLAGLWALGAAWMAGLQTVRLVRFRRLLRGAKAAPESLTALVAEIAAQLGARAPQVVLTSAACSPMIFAWGRVRLVWPESLAEPFAADSRRAVVAHELAHLRRRDHWVGWLEMVASCGWWWNPLFWYVRRQLRETAELACDAWVVELLPGGRRAYAQALVEVSEMISWTAAPAPAVGMGASARHLFERRLTMILRERVPCRAPLVGLALIGLLGIAVLPGWTKGQAPAAGLPASALPAGSLSDDEAPAGGLSAAEGAPVSDLVPKSDSRLEPSQRPIDEKVEPSRETAPQSDAAATRKPSSDAWADRYAAKTPDGEDRVRKLAEIKQLEARLAALAAELQALRGAQEGARGVLPKIGYHAIVAAPNKMKAGVHPREDRLAAIMVDVPEGDGPQELKLALFANQQIRLQLPFKTAIAKAQVDTPDVVELVVHNPHEVVLHALHPGQAVGRFWDDRERVYVVRADVLGPEAGRPAEKKLAEKKIAVFQRDFVARARTESGPGSEVETLTRAKYKLPAGRAAALATFIKEHVKEDLETKVDGDTLVVTAASDDQTRIGQFIQLLKKTPERTEAPEERRDGPVSNRSSSDAFAPPIAVDAGLPLPAGLPGQAPAATSGPKGAAPLAGSQESAPSLSPPEPDAAPR